MWETFILPALAAVGMAQSRLQGLNGLITGGDSGNGRATVIAFAREGANVAINCLPEEEPDAQNLADFLAQEEVELVTIPGDLTNKTFCAYLVEEAVRELGGLDVLIGNAGCTSIRNNMQPVNNMTTSEFERVFTTNVFANFWLLRAAVPLLPAGGSIIFTASARGANPNPIMIDYGASKAAIVHMVRSLSQQLFPQGIRANGVAPGFTFTPFLAVQGLHTEDIPLFVNATGSGRPAQPAEIAPLYVSLADHSSTYTAGEIYSGAGTQVGP